MEFYNERIILTDACNNKCSYCYQTHKKNNMLSNELTQKKIKQLNDIIKTEKDLIKIYVNLFGGEPFLNYSSMDMFLEEFKNNEKVELGIITNGTLLNEKIIERLSTFNNLNLSISMDGIREANVGRLFYSNDQTFDIVRKNMLLCLIHGVIPTIRLSIGKHNYKYLEKSLVFLKNIGIKNVIVQQICYNDFMIDNNCLKNVLNNIEYLRDDRFEIDIFCSDPDIISDSEKIEVENYLKEENFDSIWTVFQTNGISYSHTSGQNIKCADEDQFYIKFEDDINELGILSITDFNGDIPITKTAENKEG